MGLILSEHFPGVYLCFLFYFFVRELIELNIKQLYINVLSNKLINSNIYDLRAHNPKF